MLRIFPLHRRTARAFVEIVARSKSADVIQSWGTHERDGTGAFIRYLQVKFFSSSGLPEPL
jgi:hypothetical protein